MQEMTAYLDNAATTRVCDEALVAAVAMMRDCYGNPSSLHALGADSAKQMARAREAVASLLGCQPECVYFTSGGSEANNLAIFGAAGARARLGKRIVTTAAEHSSVSGAVGRLEGEGWDVVRVRPDAHGQIDARAVADAVDGQTALVSMMYVNNETGAVFPVERAARLIRAKNPRTLIHCDGVQAFGKLPVHVGRTEIDLMSVSGHKICAPKGSGALYIRRGVRVPQDMQVIGFDNVPDAEYCMPGLTTIDPHVDDYARHAVDMLIARIEGSADPFRTYVTSYDLVRRASTC